MGQDERETQRLLALAERLIVLAQRLRVPAERLLVLAERLLVLAERLLVLAERPLAPAQRLLTPNGSQPKNYTAVWTEVEAVELYNHTADDGESDNLAGNATRPDLLSAALKDRVSRISTRTPAANAADAAGATVVGGGAAAIIAELSKVLHAGWRASKF